MCHHRPVCHARRLGCCFQVQGHDWLVSWCFKPNHPQKIISEMIKVTVRAHIIKYDCFYHIYWTADLSATKFNWMVHHQKLECFVYKIRLLFSRSRTQWRFKTLLNLYVSHIFHTTDLLVRYFWSPNQVQQSGNISTITLSLDAQWAWWGWGVFCHPWQQTLFSCINDVNCIEHDKILIF